MRRSSAGAQPPCGTDGAWRGSTHLLLSGSALRLCWLPWKCLLTKILLFLTKNKGNILKQGFALNWALYAVFHSARYFHVCPTKRGITHLIKISYMLELLDELGH